MPRTSDELAQFAALCRQQAIAAHPALAAALERMADEYAKKASATPSEEAVTNYNTDDRKSCYKG